MNMRNAVQCSGSIKSAESEKISHVSDPDKEA